MTLLQIQDVCKRYGDVTVLDGLNLSVDQHEVACLIGGSGSGKSTLLRCVNGLESINSGTIRFDGDAISGRGVDLDVVRRNIGIVFQSYNLFPNMTVAQNVMLAPRNVLKVPLREAREQALELLDRVNLRDKADTYPDRLSGGQQQRVAIVRALAMDPKVLLLDEITSALDPELVGEVLKLVGELAANGMTMILATHEMAFARQVASQVYFLDKGTIHESGPPGELFRHPQRPRTQAFLKRVLARGE